MKPSLLLAVILALGAGCSNDTPAHVSPVPLDASEDSPETSSGDATDLGSDTASDVTLDASDAVHDGSALMDVPPDVVADAAVDTGSDTAVDMGQDTRPEPERIDLLGGDPIGTAPPPWDRAQHALAPTSLWGDLQGPYPTNAWWQNLVLGEGRNVVNALPYLIKTPSEGLQASTPYRVVEPNFSFTFFLGDVLLGAEEGLTGRSVIEYDPLSVTMQWRHGGGGLTAPIVRGMPYVTVLYENTTPRISSVHAIVLANNSAPGETTDLIDNFTVEFNNGQVWRLYASEPIRLRVSQNSLTGLTPFSGSLRAAQVNRSSRAVLDRHAHTYPTGAQVSATAEGDGAELVFAWEFQGPGPLMMMALPHQMDVLAGVEETGYNYNTIKGDMQGVTGDTWTLLEPLTTIAWDAPRDIAPDRREAIREALRGGSGVHSPGTGPILRREGAGSAGTAGFDRRQSRRNRTRQCLSRTSEHIPDTLVSGKQRAAPGL